MAGMEAIGRLVNPIPIAAGAGFSMKHCSGVLVVCTGNDTFTVTAASTFGGSYASPGNIITHVYTNTATNGTAAWVKTTQAASNAVTIASGTVAFEIFSDMLPDPKCYLKVSVGASGLVSVITHDLTYQRGPANLAILGA